MAGPSFPFGSSADLALSHAAALTSHIALALAVFCIGVVVMAVAGANRPLFWGAVLVVSAGAAYALAGWLVSSQALLERRRTSAVSIERLQVERHAVADGIAALDRFEAR
jgi:hypothetical protein